MDEFLDLEVKSNVFFSGVTGSSREAVMIGNILDNGELIEDVIKLNTGYGIDSELDLLERGWLEEKDTELGTKVYKRHGDEKMYVRPTDGTHYVLINTAQLNTIK